MPCGKEGVSSGRDLQYVERLLTMIESQTIAAPAPLQQTWTSSSRSPLSPAFSSQNRALFTWVDMPMYIPAGADADRVSKAFYHYSSLVEGRMMQRYNARWQWSSLENFQSLAVSLPVDETVVASRLQIVHEQLHTQLGPFLPSYNRLRSDLDPTSIHSNQWVEDMFGRVGEPTTSIAAADTFTSLLPPPPRTLQGY